MTTVVAALTALVTALVPAPPSTIIVGGGPAGLATAIALAKRGWKQITVLDRLEPPALPDDDAVWSDTARHYLIGLGGRGQRALTTLGVWDDVVEPYCSRVVGRKDWAPGATEGIERLFTDRPYETRVIPRSRLVACLLQHVERTYPGTIQVRHGIEVSEMKWTGEHGGAEERCELMCDPCASLDASDDPDVPDAADEESPEGCALVDEGGPFKLTAAFVVGADGSRRTIANAVEAADRQRRWAWPGQRFRVKRYKDTAVRVYKTVPLQLPSSWRKDINYSARTKTVNFDALPTLSGDYCGVLLIKPEDAVAQGLPNADAARAYFDATLPQFSPYIPDDALPGIVAKPPSRLPKFRYAGPRLHQRASTVLLGDAVHQVKPYFGLGVNAAFEDVAALDQCMHEAPSMGSALAAFSRERGPEARALTQISHSFDRGGVLALLTFIFPLILDGIFHGAFPRVFAPNTLAMLQKPELTFGQIRRRKRADRTLQLAVLGGGVAVATQLGLVGARAAASLLGAVRGPAAIASALPLAAALGVAAQRFLRSRVRGDVADVLAAQTKGLEGALSEPALTEAESPESEPAPAA